MKYKRDNCPSFAFSLLLCSHSKHVLWAFSWWQVCCIMLSMRTSINNLKSRSAEIWKMASPWKEIWLQFLFNWKTRGCMCMWEKRPEAMSKERARVREPDRLNLQLHLENKIKTWHIKSDNPDTKLGLANRIWSPNHNILVISSFWSKLRETVS